MRRQLQDQRQWHPVFAWWPVTTIDGQLVWLERVERRHFGSSWWEDYYEFRTPASGIEAATADETAQQAQPEARARPDAQTPTQSPSYSKYRGSVDQ